ncbi:response regulator [Chryseobacterium carnipullorum]|uniref:CAI-1 autoinducer sensor kinase/phosphatase CqsS n=1 Tax=Chryseobacterium carnipullorum TaxID=1124835 RepID=A0A376DYU0_CHRCU|nr:response regulator [Chryseobacterium carnipullorum]AZA50297.1 response regulator [Chryseobacterium carnipullorum]AZA65168.1 response regulator [Chryseobacterium carnipullorum]STC98331.1 CAI-1 autoinducer sensor kinase/phosphatase CqsS [Chryseobacterium carnipullorum]
MENRKKKILVFDDEKTILDVFTIIFAENGYEVEISETSHDILERVESFQPDLILMDNWIPNIGGIQALKLLRKKEEYKNIPVIYISANSDISALAKKAEADDFIAKPFDLVALENLVGKFLCKN